MLVLLNKHVSVAYRRRLITFLTTVLASIFYSSASFVAHMYKMYISIRIEKKRTIRIDIMEFRIQPNTINKYVCTEHRASSISFRKQCIKYKHICVYMYTLQYILLRMSLVVRVMWAAKVNVNFLYQLPHKQKKMYASVL